MEQTPLKDQQAHANWRELHSNEFNEKFAYDGPLGAEYTPQATTFRLWAPTATWVELMLGEDGAELIDMTRGERGVWEARVEDDCSASVYRYRLTFPGGHTNVTFDPWGRGSTPNSKASVVIDPVAATEPCERMPQFRAADAVFYEAHVRDLTIGRENGIERKGKFLGLTEPSTRTAAGNPSGLDYLTSLGVTHVQLLPIYDFGSVDEEGDLSWGAQYNWGYDPMNYFVPEGSYTVDTGTPYARIRQLKATVDRLHASGLRVVMDVVFNHVYDAGTNPLEMTVPGYFFRLNEDGSWADATACGNETASEQPMMRRLIVDAVTYWAREFALDGFRFDLMGIHDVETMNAVRAALDEIDPSIIVIGEGWPMGNHPDGVIPADYDHADLMPGISHFNDSFRDAMKGSPFEEGSRGFASGSADDAGAIFDGVCGSRGRYPFQAPVESVIYNEAHDDYTLFDKLALTFPEASEDEVIRRCELATTVQLLGEGIAFLHAGQEFGRTKGGLRNSYASPDSVNEFDYDRAAKFAGFGELVRGLLKLRAESPWLRLGDFAAIDEAYELGEATGSRISYTVRAGGQEARIFINAAEEPWETGLGEEYRAVVANSRTGVGAEAEGTAQVAPLSVTVAVKHA
ncbi:type I pullulanase [Arcanobacterium wilhelmae]|nr:type I pullulanase [Arcanobacterium wilhelmae]WFN91157.1 type I pullulanase [Arcanobacterium wilhelmae]